MVNSLGIWLFWLRVAFNVAGRVRGDKNVSPVNSCPKADCSCATFAVSGTSRGCQSERSAERKVSRSSRLSTLTRWATGGVFLCAMNSL
jgi:hypothetical protein